ncbi:MAG: DUF4386 domain-containing protein [Leptospirales bacterium]|nr:DUF4386 domain-containing protein [Leptospirales bacterium]
MKSDNAKNSVAQLWRITGGLLILAALGFIVVFSLLAAWFDYPQILERGAGEALPLLQKGGAGLHAVWIVYALIPFLILPVAAGLERILSQSASAAIGARFAVPAVLFLVLGLARWPSLNYLLAEHFASASPGDAAQMQAALLFDAGNRYLGNYLGELAGELCLNSWFLFTALGMRGSASFPRWLSAFGMLTAVVGLVSALRIVLPQLEPLSNVSNLLLPLWLLGLGGYLMRGPREK